MKTLEDGSFICAIVAADGPLPGASIFIADPERDKHELYVPVPIQMHDTEIVGRGMPTLMLCPVAELPAENIAEANEALQNYSEMEIMKIVFNGVCSCAGCRKRAN